MGKERKEFFKSLPKELTYKPYDNVTIGKYIIGKNRPVFIIAEAGGNHRGNINNAFKLINKAKEAKADAIKFQHLTHNKIAADNIVYDTWNGKPVGALSNFFKSAELPYEWTPKLIAYARKKGIMFLSTPFDKEAVNILNKSKVDAFKIGSYELTDDILLSCIAKTKKPIILSTGMADMEEIAHAIKTIQQAGNKQIILLHCVSMYPPAFTDLNLRAVSTLRQSFKIPIGYSDHSKPPYIAPSIVAVALGASVIEKHLTDNQSGGSNDDSNSIDVENFKLFVQEIRHAEMALSQNGIKQPVINAGHKNDEIFDRWSRRSVYAAVDLKPGDIISEKNIITLRPWGGIEPKNFYLFQGQKLRKGVKARKPLTIKHFQI